MKKKILIVSIMAVFTLVAISFASAVSSNTVKSVDKKESPLYGIRTRRAIGERLGMIIDYIKTKFLGDRLFFIPFQWLRDLEGRSVRMLPTWNSVFCIPTQCSGFTCDYTAQWCCK